MSSGIPLNPLFPEQNNKLESRSVISLVKKIQSNGLRITKDTRGKLFFRIPNLIFFLKITLYVLLSLLPSLPLLSFLLSSLLTPKILKDTFNSDQKIFGRAYWPTAIYNLPFGKTESGDPVYGPDRLEAAFALEFGLIFKIDGVAQTGLNSPEEGFWTISEWQRGFRLRKQEKDKENDIDNFYLFSHSLPIPVAGVNKVDNWGIANYYFNQGIFFEFISREEEIFFKSHFSERDFFLTNFLVFYPLPKKAYQIDIELKFRLVPTTDHNPQQHFPTAKTEWSHVLASGSFNVNVSFFFPLPHPCRLTNLSRLTLSLPLMRKTFFSPPKKSRPTSQSSKPHSTASSLTTRNSLMCGLLQIGPSLRQTITPSSVIEPGLKFHQIKFFIFLVLLFFWFTQQQNFSEYAAHPI